MSSKAGTSRQAMSRLATTKSRGDKSRTVTVAQVQQVAADVIPGRFTEDDWLSMVADEDGEDVVGDIVDDVISRVMDECFTVYLTRQVIPYTVSQARDAITHIIKWTFMPRDKSEDELDSDTNWQEEPALCPNDSWAQGCVPVTQPVPSLRSSHPQASSEHLMPDIPEQEAEAGTQTLDLTISLNSSEYPTLPNPRPAESEAKIQTVEPQKYPQNFEDLPLPNPGQEDTQPYATQASQLHIKPTPPLEPKKTRNRYHPHRGPLRSAGFKNITKSLEETEKEMLLDQFLREKEENKADETLNLLPTSLHNILKIQLMRPPQKNNLIYDDAGNILSVPQVDLSKLPRHHVIPHIEVLDASKQSGRKAGNVGVGAPSLVRKRVRRSSDKEANKLCEKYGLQLHPASYESQVSGEKTLPLHALTRSSRADATQGPNPVSAGILLDTMQLSHGVILREGNLTKRGSLDILQQRGKGWTEDRRVLRPIRASITLPSVSVDQLIKNNIPQVQPLVSFISP
ncbi:uncharacterized protein C2orf81 homolog isoform X2 [Pseudophryne corroboree]|uniref:uncharacterized protein C2orf81 homolog isoform X2 n=1 Tax=Pseudophryne corroboree TaxID=495146 RepID=UPI003081E268